MSNDANVDGERANSELARLAASIRRLIEAAVTVKAPDRTLAAAADATDRVAAALERHVSSPPPPRYPPSIASSDPNLMMPYDPIMGRLSPLAPPLRFEWQEPKAIAWVRFGKPYEGPPGCVHGGVIASAFDQVLNVANLMRGVAGPTKRLEIRFRRPTPLSTELRFEGWQEGVEDRQVHAAGRLLVGDEVSVEAEGWFMQVPFERVMNLLQSRPSGADKS